MIIAGSDGSTLTTWLEGDSTGEVVVFGNPTKNLGIATKQYVDSEITSAVAAENEISEMNDVTLTSIQTGDILQWNGSAFVNFALGTIGTMAAQNANAVNISGSSPSNLTSTTAPITCVIIPLFIIINFLLLI